MPDHKKKRNEAVNEKIKNEICLAVKKLLARKHPRHLTMELVAQKAGIPRGTLYNYFKNKGELIAHIILGIVKPYEENAEAIAQSDAPTLDKMQGIAALSMSIADEKKEFFAIVAEYATQAFSQSFFQKEAQASEMRDMKRIEKIIEGGLREGIFCDLPLDAIVLTYFGIVGAFSKRITAGASRNTPAQEAKMVMKILMDGISA